MSNLFDGRDWICLDPVRPSGVLTIRLPFRTNTDAIETWLRDNSIKAMVVPSPYCLSVRSGGEVHFESSDGLRRFLDRFLHDEV